MLEETVTFQQIVDSVKESTEVDILEDLGRDETLTNIRHCLYHIIFYQYNYTSSTVIKRLFFRNQHGGISCAISRVEEKLNQVKNNLTKNMYNMIKDGLVKKDLWEKRLILK